MFDKIKKLITPKEANIPEPVDMRDFLVPMQQLVNAILKCNDKSGADVLNWSMNDFIALYACLTRFDNREEK